MSASLRGGCLNPFSSSRINDRFLLGGPTSLRGFSLWGAGPQDLGFAVGGEAYWASALHLFTPLPLLSKSGVFGLFRMHGFITAGNSIRNCNWFCRIMSDVIEVSKNRIQGGISAFTNNRIDNVRINEEFEQINMVVCCHLLTASSLVLLW